MLVKNSEVSSPGVSQCSHIDIHGCGVGSRGAPRDTNRRNRHNNVYRQHNDKRYLLLHVHEEAGPPFPVQTKVHRIRQNPATF